MLRSCGTQCEANDAHQNITVIYEQLAEFLERRMRMSHVYQPVMLMALLERGGMADEREIAEEILRRDQSQLEYYGKITRDMVGRVLRNHGIVERHGKTYRLVGFETFTAEQVEHLVALCRDKLDEYLQRQGERIWSHRKQSAGYVSGTIRYEILKRAKFRCDLCGISAEERALEVDHILPRSKGGTDDPENLQALCYSCNAMKRDRDDTDFREVRSAYEHRKAQCVFCTVPEEHRVAENSLAFAIRDAYPVTEYHSLVIPKRHTESYFGLGSAERNACDDLLQHLRREAVGLDPSIRGFNIGINDGTAAGQTIFHCHLHLIPRRSGDVAEPEGGVRHVIPGKGNYRVPGYSLKP